MVPKLGFIAMLWPYCALTMQVRSSGESCLMPVLDAPPAPVVTPAQGALGALRDDGTVPARTTTVAPLEARCPPSADGTIVVCGSDPDAYRISPLASTFAKPDGRAEFSVAPGTRIDVHVEASPLAGGAISKRIMVGVKIKF